MCHRGDKPKRSRFRLVCSLNVNFSSPTLTSNIIQT
uniref:Uncharacterized protein n=1 Tax=Rhizophora mucronata TaxID=61149 RepID=A0A2P2IKG2_RHIMU